MLKWGKCKKNPKTIFNDINFFSSIFLSPHRGYTQLSRSLFVFYLFFPIPILFNYLIKIVRVQSLSRTKNTRLSLNIEIQNEYNLNMANFIKSLYFQFRFKNTSLSVCLIMQWQKLILTKLILVKIWFVA